MWQSRIRRALIVLSILSAVFIFMVLAFPDILPPLDFQVTVTNTTPIVTPIPPAPCPNVPHDLAQFTTDHFFNDPFNRSKVAIVYLIKGTHLHQSLNGITTTFKYFNQYYKYPVLIFHESDLNVHRARDAYAKKLQNEELLNLIEFIEFQFPPIPSDFDVAKEKNNITYPKAFPGYHQMCIFWFKQVFEHPRIQNLTYFMRLDSDGYIISNFSMDPFQMMYEKKFLYGTRVQNEEPLTFVINLDQFLLAYLQDKKPVNFNFTEMNDMNRQQFYNNFEIVHVPSYTMPHIKDFYEQVDQTRNIYRRRWGDGPLRYYTTRVFFPSEKVFTFCEFRYLHQPKFFNTQKDCPTDTKGHIGIVMQVPEAPMSTAPPYATML